MNKELEDAASKRAGEQAAVNVPSLVRADAGSSQTGPGVANPDPAIPAVTGTSSVVPSVSTDFNVDDVSDGGDVAKGAISPTDFLRMASGVSSAETEKPLPPLPSDVSSHPLLVCS